MNRVSFFILLSIILAGCTQNGTEKNYSIKYADDLKIICNENRGSLKDLGYRFSEEFSFKGILDSDIILFSNILRLKTDSKNNIYILDSRNFCIVKFSDQGKFLKKFGRQGNGPGEFTRPYDLEIQNDTIFLADNEQKKMVLFDQNGNFIKDLHPPDGAMPQMLTAIGKDKFMGILFGVKQVENIDYIYFNLTLMDKNFNPLKIFNKIEEPYNPKDFRNSDYVTYFTNSDKEIFIAVNSENEYKIKVFDFDGNHKYNIVKQFKKVPYNKEELERYQQMIQKRHRGRSNVNINEMKYKKAITRIRYDYKKDYLMVWPAINRDENNQFDYVADFYKDGIFLKRQNFKDFKGLPTLSEEIFVANNNYKTGQIFIFNPEGLELKGYRY